MASSVIGTSIKEVASYTYDKVVVSKNVAILSATLDGTTPQGIAYIPYNFPTFNRANG